MTPRQKPWQKGRHRRRRFNYIEPRKKVLIVTEGLTEANYFENYKKSDNLIIIQNKADNKRSLVEKAIKSKAEVIRDQGFGESDNFWVVLDRDTQADNKKDKEYFNAALQLAKNHNISVAWSNDAFELWLILHFQDLRSAVSRVRLCQMLSRHLGEKYDKAHPSAYFEKLLPLRDRAIARAGSLLTEIEDHLHGHINPSTSVHILVELLLAEESTEA